MPSPELLQSVSRKAVTLRANALGRIADFPDLFSPHWRPQEGATVATEDGDIPEDWADYTQSLKRPNRWAD
eukprot:14184229-Alexandrium_andersonii.AAC.1